MTEFEFPIGEQLVKVEYEMFDYDDYPESTSVVDDVSMAVYLEWSDLSRARLGWRTPGYWYEEGLMVGGLRNPNADIVDMSRRWSFLLGLPLETLSFSYTPYSPPLVWAINFGFEGDINLIVALGQIQDNEVTYMPNNLIVTASQERAHNYRPSNDEGYWTSTSAWGD